MTVRRVAVYGDVDLNYIDGSSIWLVSLCSVLAQIPDVEVELLLKAPIRRDLLTSTLPRSILIHEPVKRRTHEDVAESIVRLDEQDHLDVVIVRGRELAARLVDQPAVRSKLWAYLTDVPQQMDELGGEAEHQLRAILGGARRILCQTEDLRAWFAALVPECDHKLLLLPPMVPDEAYRPHPRPWLQDGLKMLYAGKFAPDWGFVELVDQIKRLRDSGLDLSLIVAGDKIHDPPDSPGFADSVREALEDPSVDWRGGVSREAVFELLDHVDLALSVRTSALDDSRELSTKLLEYSAAGVPVVANRTRAHVELFGEDYPFLVSSFDELPRVAHTAAERPDTLEWASKSVSALAVEYSFTSAAEDLEAALRETPSDGRRLTSTRRVLVAGHDLKFIRPLMEGWEEEGYEIATDRWLGHSRHDPITSASLLAEADVIVCEWLLGNAVYFANHAPPDLPLVVRLHRMEVDTEWPRRLPMARVDRVVVVSDHLKRRLVADFGYPQEKIQVISNGVDPLAYARPKLPGAEFTLGMLGYLPRLKRLDRALHLLKSLRAEDPRYRLVVKGKRPDELRWVWENPDERSYFEAMTLKIESDPGLAGSVVFEPAGPATPSWFRKIGYVLSPSDIESFHLSMVEGMTSAAVPVVWQRDGASDLVDPRWVHATTEEAAEWLVRHADDWAAEGRAARALAHQRYAMSKVRREWSELLARVSQARPTTASPKTSSGSPHFGELVATDMVGQLRSVASLDRSLHISVPYRYRFHTPTEIDVASTRMLLAGRFQPSRLFAPVESRVPPDWKENPFENVTWDFSRHSLEWLEPVIRCAAQDDEARRLALGITTDWIQGNSRPPGFSRRVWMDHTVAIRTRLMLFLLFVLDSVEGWERDVDRNLVLSSLVQHGAFLADAEHYVANSNHGLEMDASLLALSICLPGIRFARRWRDIAEKRLDAYLRRNYSTRFVHLEQSPGYHLFVTVRLMSIAAFLTDNDLEVPSSLRKYLTGAAAVWPYFRRPDRSAPMIGDTPLRPTPTDFEVRHEQLMGTRPRSIAPEDRLNPRGDGASAFVDTQAGYAIYADQMPATEPTLDHRKFQVVVKCNTFESPHYHHDAGSFVIWWEGDDWIVDSGYYSMEERSPERRYMRAARAHNVVLVDEEDFRFCPFEVIDVFRDQRGDGLEMFHDLGPVHHRRRVIVSATDRVVLIQDKVEVQDGSPHQITQLLHMHPRIQLSSPSANRILGERGGRSLRIDRTGPGDLEVLSGDENGHAVAWYSADYMRREASNVLRWTMTTADCLRSELRLEFEGR